LSDVPQDKPRLFLLSRVALAWTERFEAPSHPALLMCGQQVVGWFVPAGAAGPPASFLSRLSSPDTSAMVRIELSGRVLRYVWEMVTLNRAQLSEDIRAAAGAESVELPAHVRGVDGEPVFARLGRNVRIEPGVVVETAEGPVWFDDGVHVRAFTRIAGPAYIGRGTTVLGGSLSAVSIGASCKVRGELEETVLLGHTNKAHDGFIGHSYIGRWVNLGALTTNSDLKNNYSTVRVWTPNGEQDTGERKIGCFLGDHVKTAIGTLLNTGTLVGPGANLFGTNMPPKHVRPFSWGGGVAVHDLNRFLETARIVMQRRGESLTPGVERLMRALWRETAGEVA
jgi:UDP-N-acetylglucosamine diphosphorylase/glucosamine-1-phosphate N-acetyltransferase